MAATEKVRWKPGQSGNPSGFRHITKDIAELARDYSAEAIGRLAELMRQDKFPTVAVRACEILLERGYGKAPVIVDVTHSVDSKSLQDAALAILRRRLEAGELVDSAAPLLDKPK